MTSFRSVRGLRPLLASELLSSFAIAIQGTAIPWLVLEGGGSAGDLGLAVAVQLVSLLVFGLPLSAVAAQVGARRWVLGSNIVGCGVALLTAMLAINDVLNMGVLVLLVAVVGGLRGATHGSQQELLAQFVAHDTELLSRATSVLQGANRAALMVGPPVAGVLVATVGPPVALLVTAAGALVVVIVIKFAVPALQSVRSVERSRILDGIRELRRDRLVSRWSIAVIFSEAAYQALFVAIPLLALQRYEASAALSGTLLGLFGGGALAGSMVALALSRRPPLKLALIGKIAQGALFIVLILPLPSVAMGIILAFLGVANGLSNGPAAAVQIPRLNQAYRGSALTASFTLAMGGGAAGSALAGTLIDNAGFMIMFIAAAVLVATSSVLFISGARLSSNRRLSAQSGEAGNRRCLKDSSIMYSVKFEGIGSWQCPQCGSTEPQL